MIKISELSYKLSALLYKNEKSENDALEGYSKLLEEFTEVFNIIPVTETRLKAIVQRGINVIRKIMSDEKNHRLNLQALEYELDQVVIASDGMAEILEIIVDSVDKSAS